MRELITMALALGLLVTLLRLKIRIGRAMCASSLALAIMLKVTPAQMAGQLTAEFTDPAMSFTQTTTYLFISLTALLLLVNVIGAVMQETPDRSVDSVRSDPQHERSAIRLLRRG